MRRQLKSRKAWIESERERLANEKEKTLDLLNRSRIETPRIYEFAQDKLEQALKATQDFERKQPSSLPASKEYRPIGSSKNYARSPRTCQNYGATRSSLIRRAKISFAAS